MRDEGIVTNTGDNKDHIRNFIPITLKTKVKVIHNKIFQNLNWFITSKQNQHLKIYLLTKNLVGQRDGQMDRYVKKQEE